MDIVGFLFGFGCLQGLTLAAVLLLNKTDDRFANILMASLAALLSIHFAYLLLIRTEFFFQHPQFGVIFGPLKFLWGPLLFLYAYAMTSHTVSRWHLAHIIPFLLMFIPVAVFLSYPSEDQISFLKYLWRGDKSDVRTDVIENLPYFWKIWVNYYLHGTFFALQFAIYCIVILHLIHNHNHKLYQIFSNLDQRSLHWLGTLTKICLAFLIIYVLFNRSRQFFVGHIDINSFLANMPFLFLVLAIYAIGFKALYQPNILHGLKETEDSIDSMNSDSSISTTEVSEDNKKMIVESNIEVTSEELKDNTNDKKPEKYTRSRLSQEDAEAFRLRLINVMQEEELYLNCDLTMPDLAKHASLAPYQVSQVLNGIMNQSFFYFVNSYRIELAKELISDESHNMTILDIAMEAGFKSKSSFYNAFKRETQMTPMQYKNNLKELTE